MKKKIFGWGIFALALISFAPTLRAQKKEPRPATSNGLPGWANHQYLNIDMDSSTNPPQMIATYKSDALYNMIISQGRLTSLYANGKLVPADSFYLYDALVKRIVEQVKRDSLQAIRDKEQAARDVLQAGRDQEQALRDKKQAEEDAQQAATDKQQAERDAQQAYRDKTQADHEAIDAKSEAERDAKQAALDRDQALRDKKQAERDAEQAFRDKQQAERDREQAVRDRKQAEEDRVLLKMLLGDVVKEGLAPDEKSIVSLILDETVFFVNGKKQSDELQQKFKEKYIRKEGYSFYIHHRTIQIGRRD